MTRRFDILKDCRDSLAAIAALDRFIDFSGLNDGLVALVSLRISELDGSLPSIAHYTERALEMGKSAQWVASVATWRKSSIYTPVEQAVLEFTDYIAINRGEVTDYAYDALRHLFIPSDIAKLVLAIGAARMWCQLAHLAKTDPHTNRRSRDTFTPRSPSF
ncbi:carboxymuconolactone decarboxylase family protein [Rhizobium sp.]|jgi:alkylhydroperoxidase family enzyme|uniref:carboxymuconolactone decarboxylase family protein n=1 Tax=Rhizobium sp. TaxID=391 RepID=UPI0013AF7F23